MCGHNAFGFDNERKNAPHTHLKASEDTISEALPFLTFKTYLFFH
jgi:hypothetical protein